MQVGILSAAPLPGSVKVARRTVKPFVLVRVQVWQPISGCNVSGRRPRPEDAGALLFAKRSIPIGHLTCKAWEAHSCHPDHFWKAGRYKLAAPVPKTGSASPRSERYRRLPPFLAEPPNERKSHEACSPLSKSVALSQELQTKSCHPNPPGETELRLSPSA